MGGGRRKRCSIFSKGGRGAVHVKGGGGGLAVCVAGQPRAWPQEDGVDLTYFYPARAHLLLQEVYGYFPHYNYGLYLDGGVRKNVCDRFVGTG